MSQICSDLHNLLFEGARFHYEWNPSLVPANGLYILFQNGEVGHSGDRIVRIGTHTGQNQLPSRLKQHFQLENKNRSIFRKNIGRCILRSRHSEYLSVWEIDMTSRANSIKYHDLVNYDLEKKIESEISEYIRTNFSFVLIADQDKKHRLELEAQLIGTVSQCQECESSVEWLGNVSPAAKIRESGLWQVMELQSPTLTMTNLDFVKTRLMKPRI